MNDSKLSSLSPLIVAPLVITCVIGMGFLLPSAVLAQSSVVSTNQAVSRLKSGDRLRLTVTGFPEISGEQTVLADGTLQFPLAGAVAIAGKTPSEAVTTITEALRPYIRRPQVGLALLSIRPPRISITGEVLHPGPRLVTALEQQQQQQAQNSPDTGGEAYQTVSYALVLAGGVTPNADIRNIIIRRLEPNPNLQNPGSRNLNELEQTDIKVDLWQAIQTGDLASDPQIVDGDEIIVPATRVSSADQQQILTSTIAPNRITIQIAGSVHNPGSVQIAPNSGVNGAIAAAGGLTNDASRKLALLRMSADGTLERNQVTFGDNSEPLREGDVIVASRTELNSVLNVVGTLLSPITSLFYLFR